MTSLAFEKVSISLSGLNGPLTSVDAWTLTPFGNLTVSWVKTANTAVVTLGIPVGVEATIVPPTNSPGFDGNQVCFCLFH